MRYAIWAAPFVFCFSFVRGYLMEDPPHLGTCVFFGIVCALCGATGLFAPSPRRVWALVNLAAALWCAYAMVDSALHHNNYSGYGALVIAPVGIATALSMLVFAFFAVAKGAEQ